MLLEEGMNINVVLLPEGEDPDSYAQSHSSEEVEEYINLNKVDFIRFKTNLLLDEVGDDPVRRASLIGDVVRSIAVVPNDILRSEYIKKCSEMLNVGEQLLVSETAKLRLKHAEELYKRKQQGNATQSAADDNPQSDEPFIISTQEQIQQAATTINPIQNKERAIIQFLLRNGDKLVQVPEDKANGTPAFSESVISHLHYSFQGDGIEFTHPLYKRIFDEASEHAADINFVPEKYFQAHPDAEISHLAAELCNDRYFLSKLFSESRTEEHNENAVLFEQTTRLIIAYKQGIIDELLKQTMAQLKDPQIAADSNRYMEVMQNFKYLKETQQALNAQLTQYGFGSVAFNF